MDMSIPYESGGRVRQKARTRSSLLRAARELLGEGVNPTVEQVADRAEISRTTAYRYFPNQRKLLAATYPELEASSLLGVEPPSDPVARLEVAAEEFTRHVLTHEPALRAQLRLALDPAHDPASLPFRQGRGIIWIEEALSPLRDTLGAGELRTLALSIRATLGIEALVWLTDVAGLDREQAVELMRASARTLLRAALADAAG